MSLNLSFRRLLSEYLKESNNELTNNELANYVRHTIPEEITHILGDNERYIVKGSVGQGNWAEIPWVAIFDKFITDSAQDGYYVVYLVREDCSGIFLSLNQGVTKVRENYGSNAKEALTGRANDFANQLGNSVNGYIVGPIQLLETPGNSLGSFYEVGSICSKYYHVDSIPDDIELKNDLINIMNIYTSLSRLEISLHATLIEDDENSLETEDLTILREHKRIERNSKLSLKAKNIHGYVCQACGFNFKTKYGELGNNYIEAHHLQPLSELKGKRVLLDPDKDFVVLCSNCHKMIHRSEFVGDIDKFKIIHLKNT